MRRAIIIRFLLVSYRGLLSISLSWLDGLWPPFYRITANSVPSHLFAASHSRPNFHPLLTQLEVIICYKQLIFNSLLVDFLTCRIAMVSLPM